MCAMTGRSAGRIRRRRCFRYSRDRSGDHPVEHLEKFAGILQADIYAGYNALYVAGRSPGPVIEAACWAHSRRKFFDLADIAAGKRRGKDPPPVSPLALEAVKRIDVLFDIERGIVGKSAEERLAVRRELSAPVLSELKEWMRAERVKLSKHAPVAKAMDYMLRRWELFAPLPRRRPHLPHQQCRREGAQRYCPGPQVMALRRLGPRRRAGGGDVHAHRHRQAQRCRSAGLARRRARPDRGHAADPARRTPPLELGSGTEARSGRIEPGPREGGGQIARGTVPLRASRCSKSGLNTPAVFGGCLRSSLQRLGMSELWWCGWAARTDGGGRNGKGERDGVEAQRRRRGHSKPADTP